MKKLKKLTDECLMPWGKYKGEELQDAPASYLVWLEGEMRKNDTNTDFNNGLLVYIDENRNVLEKEAKEQKFKKYK